MASPHSDHSLKYDGKQKQGEKEKEQTPSRIDRRQPPPPNLFQQYVAKEVKKLQISFLFHSIFPLRRNTSNLQEIAACKTFCDSWQRVGGLHHPCGLLPLPLSPSAESVLLFRGSAFSLSKMEADQGHLRFY